MPDISVVISSYNSLPKLRLCLNAYRNQTLSHFEVIVAVDGSSDGTLEYIRANLSSFPFRLRCVWHEDKGFRLARIRNCAWRIANSDRVVFTDNDMVPQADCLEQYARFNKTNYAFAGYIGWINEVAHSSFTEDNIGSITDFEPYMTQPESRDLSTADFWRFWGGNISLAQSTYPLTNGFDEEFTAWGGEDTDIGMRLTLAGVSIKPLPEAKMFHLNHPSSNSNKREGAEFFYKHKVHSRVIRRNENADYSDVVVIG